MLHLARVKLHGRWPVIASLLMITSPAALLSSSALASETIAPLAIVAPVKACSDLAKFDIVSVGGKGSRITAASEATENGVSFCKVEGTMAPSIGFKVQLPLKGWTQRYLQLGCGGLCGSISLTIGAADGNAEVAGGNFVIAATDMGHQGMDSSFGRDPVKLVDFAYRSQHLTAELSKKLIQAFYGQPQAFAYFDGCSDGGREAVMETQRYPQDFNGVIAGAPAMLFQFQNSLHHGWLSVSNTGSDGKPIFVGTRLPILHKAVLEACDALDGLKDGLVSEPRLCHFDPATIQCAADAKSTDACLTAAEVKAAKNFYNGPVDPVTGEHLTVGEEQYGSELTWEGVFVPHTKSEPIFSTMIALSALQNVIFEKAPPASYTLKDLAFTKATIELLKPRHPLLDAVNPDLSAFHAAGGKLILWHGWADPHISPRTTIAYHEALEATMGQDVTKAFQRLYLLPGVAHCGGGEGMASLDLLTPMMAWVEHNQAPDAVITKSKTETSDFGQPTSAKKADKGGMPPEVKPTVARTRPVYPYPALPKYTGQGDQNEAANYVSSAPLYTETTASWAGESFFKPYQSAQ